MQGPDLQTPMQWYHYTCRQLQRSNIFLGPGYDSYQNESAALVLLTLQLETAAEEQLHKLLTKQQQQQLQQAFRQRIQQRLPTAYITNRIYYAGIEFYINEAVLIPRSPFAQLIENNFEAIIDLPKPCRLLDLCCGCGCIGIASLLKTGFIESVLLADVDPKALRVAAKNRAKYPSAMDRVEIIESDLFQNIACQKFDLILSNPPYLDEHEMRHLPPEYQHEPRLGLQGKRPDSNCQNGLQLVDEILNQASDYLSADGVLLLEVGASIEAFRANYQQLNYIELDLNSDPTHTSLIEGVLMINQTSLRQFQSSND